MSDVQPGWYDDGHGQLRWWDGNVWTDHVSPPAAQVAAAPADAGQADALQAPAATYGYVPVPSQPAPRKGVPVWVWVVSGIGIVAISAVAIVVAVVVATRAAPFKEAEAALRTYDAAWLNVDCGALAEATTEAFREDWGYDDCSQFEADANEFGEAARDYKMTINSREYEGGVVTVKTTESYEDDGPAVDHVTYTVVKDGEAWRIDAIDFDDDKSDTSTDA